jgi:FlaA1/EpsC-like NDP-sugar epimerase
MLYLSGRSPKKNILGNYYGLNNIEKISEKLISKNEKILKILDKRIFEINRIYKKVNLKKLNTLIYNNQNNKKLKVQLKNLI